MPNIGCYHWREYDTDHGWVEWCKGIEKSCSCTGEKDMCNYPQFFNCDPGILEDLRNEHRAERSAANIEPYL